MHFTGAPTRRSLIQQFETVTPQAVEEGAGLLLVGKTGKSKRQPELDGLRGLLLVWMTLTHLPTHVSAYSNQTFGFVSAAEGFIFLSALLCGRVFFPKLTSEGSRSVWRKLGMRAARLYAYHLSLLAVAFTFVAHLAVHTKQPSLQGLLDFYLAHPVDGVISSILLIYRPPLMDILPMYILFLLLTPLVLSISARWSWRPVLIGSLLVWAAAQFGLRVAAYEAMKRITGMDIPFSALGAFDLFAWQFLWITGLWVGSGRAGIPTVRLNPKLGVSAAIVIAAFFLIVRHSPWWDVMNGPAWIILTDKWHLGALRLLNFAALTTLFAAVQPATVRWLGRGPAVLLGQASLEVFCAHLLVCFAALAWVDDGTNASIPAQVAILCFAMVFLYATAKLFSKERKKIAALRRIEMPAD